jgi:hypothetical protein
MALPSACFAPPTMTLALGAPEEPAIPTSFTLPRLTKLAAVARATATWFLQ